MGGKGRRRREKNYQAAHGGAHTGLPPPPDRSTIDAVPAKLRKLMSLTGAEIGRPASKGVDKKIGDRSRATEKMLHSEDKLRPLISVVGEDGENLASEYLDDEVEEDIQNQSATGEKKKKKRKRKLVSDLRFEELDQLSGTSTKRKERRKQRSEERKKKRKKNSQEDNLGFRTRDEVKFGEVVEAPPKLSVPKSFKKTTIDASKERLRLQAIEAYRERKGTSRLGVQLPVNATLSEGLQFP